MMKEKTLVFIKEHQMIPRNAGVIIGLSGGADSVCLLNLLWTLKEELEIELRAVHVHHGIRGDEADRDASFSAEICRELKIPFRLVSVDARKTASERKLSVEEAGRFLRYRELERAAEVWEQEDKRPIQIAVAHHSGDSAETILYNLVRGSGLKGLSGIPPVRGRIIRPILWAEKQEIQHYLKQEELAFVEDSSNRESEYARNRIRNEIIPQLTAKLNPQTEQNILRAAGLIGQADRYFDRMAEDLLGKYFDQGYISIDVLTGQEEIIRGYLIRKMISAAGGSLKDVTLGHIEDILSLTEKGTGKQVSLPGGLAAENVYGRLHIFCRADSAPVPENELSQLLKMRIFPCENPLNFPKNQYTKWFDYDRIKDTLSVRFRQAGDYITLASGGRKTIKSYMIDAKIPQDERGQIPLLAEGSHILWIIGYRISEYYKMTEYTKTVLEVQFDGGIHGGR